MVEDDALGFASCRIIRLRTVIGLIQRETSISKDLDIIPFLDKVGGLDVES